MIVVHGEPSWLPAPQPMDGDDVYAILEDVSVTETIVWS